MNGIKAIGSVFMTTILCVSSFGIPLFKEPDVVNNTNNDPKIPIIVSMGDSYSSGEGNEPFYDQDKDIKEKCSSLDWLAHRSELAWPGQLYYDDGTTCYRYKDMRNKNWFFVAASGAETKDIFESQKKEYNKNIDPLHSYVGEEYLPRQLNVFSDNNLKGKVDYVTLTLGGNDVGFEKIITKAATNIGSISTSKLEDEFAKAWEKWNILTQANLLKVYESIAEEAGPQAKIIVAGYPPLADPNGKGEIFSRSEAEIINENIEKFNSAIEELVIFCKEEKKINIEFVSVYEKFETHEPDTDDEYINGLIYLSQKQDLKDNEMNYLFVHFISAYSYHPNINGQGVYAESVQEELTRTGPFAAESLEGSSVETVPAIDMDILKAAYREVLLEYEDDMRSVENGSSEHDGWGAVDSCALSDITGDDYPELIILYSSEGRYGDGNWFSADIRIFTILPGDSEATEMLHIPEASHFTTYGMTSSDVILLSNGNLLVQNNWGDEFWITTYTEYAPDDNTFEQINCFRCDEKSIFSGPDHHTYEYSINGESVSEEDYNTQINDFMSASVNVLSMSPFYTNDRYDNLSAWGKTVYDTPNNIMSFDEAWTILNISSSDLDMSDSKDKSYYVNELSGWWTYVGMKGSIVTYYFKFTEDEMEKYIHNDDGTNTFESSTPVKYDITSDGYIKIYNIDSSNGHYYLQNDYGCLEAHWEDNGYSGSGSLTRVNDYDGIIIN